MKYSVFIFFLFFATVSTVSAQEPAYFHFSISEGLPSALIYTGLQDRNGFLWFGTDKGLARFDGTRFKVYGIKEGLLDNDVLNLYEDSRQRLWFSCFQNAPGYLLDGKVRTSETDSLLAKITLEGGSFRLWEDSQQSIWITGDQDKYCKLSNKNELTYLYSPLEINNELFPPVKRGTKSTVGTVGYVFELGKETFALGGTTFFRILERGQVQKVARINSFKVVVSFNISGNRMLVSTGNSIHLLEYRNGTIQQIEESMEYSGGRVTVDKKGRFWLLSQLNGAICFDHVRHGLKRPAIFLRDQKITDAFEDKEGTMWFCTLSDGIYALPKNAAQKIAKENGAPFQSNNIISITKLANGKIALGDDSGNLYFEGNNTWKKTNIGAKDGYNRVLQIVALPTNHWIAVSEEGIFSNTKSVTVSYNMGAPKSMYLDGNDVWCGTSHSLIVFRQNGQPKRVTQNRTTAISSDSDGNIWAGGLNGLFSKKDSFQTNWGNKFKPLSRRIIAIQQSSKDKLWVVSANYGLLEVGVKNGAVIQVKIINDSLPAPIENIQSIFVAANSKTWLATNTGVYSLDKNWKIQHYNEKNGLASNNVNAILVDNDTIWAATTQGLSKFLLKENGASDDFPTYFTGLRYMDGSKKIQQDLVADLPQNQEIVLAPGTAMLELDLAGLHYRTKGNIQFEYQAEEKLLPFWRITIHNIFNTLFGMPKTDIVEGPVLNFGTNLTPGRYLATAKAVQPSGAISSHSDQLTITILPYWWQTIWFALALALLLFAGIWRLLKTRENFLKIKNFNSELQLQAIRAQMNPHFVGNSINAIQQFFYPPDPVRASEYIAIFSDLLRRTMYFSETDFIPFEEELSYIKDYLEMIKLRFGDRFSYEISGIESLPDKGIPFPAMLLQPILENATIHGLAPMGLSQVHIYFQQHGQRLSCSVADNGVGIEVSKQRKLQKPGRLRISKGINLLEKKVETLNQLYPANISLLIEDLSQPQSKSHGTRVTITFLPIADLKFKPANRQTT